MNNKIPLTFLLTFWGDLYRFYAESYCLASLLGKDNAMTIKKLSGKIDFECAISCPKNEWESFVSSDIYQYAKEYLRFIHIEPPDDLVLSSQNKMKCMTIAHCNLIQYCVENKRWASFLYPDIVVSEGYVSLIASYLLSKKSFSFINFIAIRNCDQRIFEELNPLREKNKTLSINSFHLMDMSQKCQHPELARQDISSSYNMSGASTYFFKKNFHSLSSQIFYSLNWTPLLINYPAIAAHHDLNSLETWTLDGNYAHKNSSKKFPILTVKDNRIAAYIGFTDTRYSPFSLFSTIQNVNRHILWKMSNQGEQIHTRLKQSDLDPDKLKNFTQPIIFFNKEPSKRMAIIIRLYSKIYLMLIKCIAPLGRLFNRISDILHYRLNLNSKLHQRIKILSDENDAAIIENPLSANTAIIYHGALILHQIKESTPDMKSLVKKINSGLIEINISNAEQVINILDTIVIGITPKKITSTLPYSGIIGCSLSLTGNGELMLHGSLIKTLKPLKSSCDKIGLLIHRKSCALYVNDSLIMEHQWPLSMTHQNETPVHLTFFILLMKSQKEGVIVCNVRMNEMKYQQLISEPKEHLENVITLKRMKWNLDVLDAI